MDVFDSRNFRPQVLQAWCSWRAVAEVVLLSPEWKACLTPRARRFVDAVDRIPAHYWPLVVSFVHHFVSSTPDRRDDLLQRYEALVEPLCAPPKTEATKTEAPKAEPTNFVAVAAALRRGRQRTEPPPHDVLRCPCSVSDGGLCLTCLDVLLADECFCTLDVMCRSCCLKWDLPPPRKRPCRKPN